MDPATTTSSANTGFVGIKFCQEWFVQTFSSLLLLPLRILLVIICSIQKKIKKIEFYSIR